MSHAHPPPSPTRRTHHAPRLPALALGLLALAAAGCEPADAPSDAGVRHTPLPFSPTDATRAYCGDADDDAIEGQITALLVELTLEGKIGMMHGAAGAVVDGVWLVDGVPGLGIPGLHLRDGPRGVSAFSGARATAFPVGALRGATFDPELEARVGAAIAREARSAGADVLLAPTMNILRHPRWGRAQETYSEDVHHLGTMAVAFIEGVQSEGVIASAKHFAANSIEDSRHSVDVRIDERTLREVYLPHFRRAVVEGRVGSVMTAYNRVNGLYCDLQGHLVHEILEQEWGFSGFVESDWYLGTHGAADSVLAGLDLEMPASSRFRRLEAEVRSGGLSEDAIDDSVRRILRAQLCHGLDRHSPVRDASVRESPAHLALAREVARRGIVLLRNEGAALPFGADVRRIALLGRNARAESIGDSGSSAVRPTDVVTALEGLQARAGVQVDEVERLDAAGEALVRAADAVVVVTGLGPDDEGEGDIGAGDRETLALPEGEVALIRTVAALNPRVVVVVEAGSAVLTSAFEDDVEGLLFAFYPGAQGGHAIADLLFGDTSPSGRLPFSIPESEADLPPFDSRADVVEYGFFHGYRHLAHEGRRPRHAFGEGLSYTRFTHADLVLAPPEADPDGVVEATLSVENVGRVRGTETVQLYVSALGSRVVRAPSDLRAFAQVTLEPGERRAVTMRVEVADLAFWNDARRAFEVERLDYEVRVGAHAGDPGQTARFRVR